MKRCACLQWEAYKKKIVDKLGEARALPFLSDVPEASTAFDQYVKNFITARIAGDLVREIDATEFVVMQTEL